MDKEKYSDIKVVEKVLYMELLKGQIDVNKTATIIVFALHGVRAELKNTEDAE